MKQTNDKTQNTLNVSFEKTLFKGKKKKRKISDLNKIRKYRYNR